MKVLLSYIHMPARVAPASGQLAAASRQVATGWEATGGQPLATRRQLGRCVHQSLDQILSYIHVHVQYHVYVYVYSWPSAQTSATETSPCAPFHWKCRPAALEAAVSSIPRHSHCSWARSTRFPSVSCQLASSIKRQKSLGQQ